MSTSSQTIRPPTVANPAEAPTPTLAEAAPVFTALAGLATTFGHLPIPYVVVQRTSDLEVGLQLETPGDFEPWREALGIASEAVEVRGNQESSWLRAVTTHLGMQLTLTAHGLGPNGGAVAS